MWPCVAIIAALGGCDSPTCGSGNAPDDGISASDGQQVTLVYGGFTVGSNHDCPATDNPNVNFTIMSMQMNGTGALTLCVEHGDRFGSPTALGPDVLGSPVHVIDVSGTANGCMFDVAGTSPITGTAHADGLCDDGADPAGFALDIAGNVTLTRMCDTVIDTVAVTLTGRTKVVPQH